MLVVLEGSCLGRTNSLKRYVRRLKKSCLVLLRRDERAGRGNHQVGLFRLTINYNGEMLFSILLEKPIFLVSSPFQLRTKNC